MLNLNIQLKFVVVVVVAMCCIRKAQSHIYLKFAINKKSFLKIQFIIFSIFFF